MKTKVLLSIIAITLTFSATFGQSLADLDAKNGFKDFKIGDLYSKWQANLQYEGYGADSTKQYTYTGACCNMVFDYPVETITLYFKDNKLVVITIELEKFQKEYSTSGKYTTWRKDDF